MRARTVPILLAVALAGAGCGSDEVSRQASPPSGRGDAKDSLFRTANLRRALRVLGAHAGASATLVSFRLEPGALTTEVAGGAGRSVVVTKRFRLTSVPTPGVVPAGAVNLTQVDAAAPERIMARVTPLSGVGLRGVDYFAIANDASSGRLGWVVYLKGGKGIYAADLSGAGVRATSAAPAGTSVGAGTPPAGTTAPATPAAPSTGSTPSSTTPSPGLIQRQTRCIANAHGDSAKIAACLRAP